MLTESLSLPRTSLSYNCLYDSSSIKMIIFSGRKKIDAREAAR
jgi:hypothetical protein